MFLTVTTAKNKALWNAVTPFLKSGNFTGAMQRHEQVERGDRSDHDVRLEPRAFGAPS